MVFRVLVCNPGLGPLQKNRTRTTISILEMKEKSLRRGGIIVKGHMSSEQYNQDSKQVNRIVHPAFLLLYTIMVQTVSRDQ